MQRSRNAMLYAAGELNQRCIERYTKATWWTQKGKNKTARVIFFASQFFSDTRCYSKACSEKAVSNWKGN